MFASLKQSGELFTPSVFFTLKFNDANAFKHAHPLLFPSDLEGILQICDEPTSSVNIRGIFKPLQDDFYGYYLLALLHFPSPRLSGEAV